MIEQEKLDKVIEILVNRGLVDKFGTFTDTGRDFTRQKSRNAWCIIRSDNCLCVPVVPKRLDEDDSLHYTR